MRSSPASRGTQRIDFARIACFALTATALAYAVFNEGGQTVAGWNLVLLILGVGALVYLPAVPRGDRPPFFRQLTGWAVILPVAYIGLQVVPLPLPVLKLLSPARAALVDAVTPIMHRPGSAPISIDPATTVVYLIRTVAYALTAYLIWELFQRERHRRPWSIAIPLIGIAGFEACLGIIQSADGGEVQGTYHSGDHFAGLLEMALPLAIAYGIALMKVSEGALPLRRALIACVSFAAAAAMLIALIYSQSKMGFAAAIAGLFAMGAAAVFFKLNGIARCLAVAGLAISGILAFVFLPTEALANEYVNFFSHDTRSVEGRGPVWSDSRKLVSAYPAFGTGLGTYETAFLKYQTAYLDWDYTFAHNDYIELTSELGAVGILIFGGLFVIVLRNTAETAFAGEHWDARLLGLGCTGAIVAIGIHSLVDFNLYIPANALLLSWIVGIALALRSPVYRARPEAKTRPNMSRAILRSLSAITRAVPFALACLPIGYAIAWIVFETQYGGDARPGSAFCRLGICGTDTVLAAEGRQNATPSTIATVPELQEALWREPAAPQRWCDLGDGLLRTGRVKEARYCYSRALELGPEIPPILVRSAQFYHTLHDDERALKQGAHVLKNSDAYQAITLDWYRDQKFAVSDVLRLGLPPGTAAAGAYLDYWMALGEAGNAKTTWDWMLSHRNAAMPATGKYINFLFANGAYQEGSAAWAQFLGDRRDGYREANWLFNGDFESEPSGVPLDWQIDSMPGEVEAGVDSSVAFTGRRSLRIRFAGNDNVSYAQTTEETSVPPGNYRFAAYVRTERITTDKGIGFRIFDAEDPSRLDTKTAQFTGTTDWSRVDQVFRVSSATKVLQVQVIRDSSMRFDNRVSGTAWIDDVSLTKVD